jgi:hypothetical protein
MRRILLVLLLVGVCFARNDRKDEYHFVPVKRLVYGSPHRKVYTVGIVGNTSRPNRISVCDFNSEVTCVAAVLRTDMKAPNLHDDINVYGEYHDRQLYVDKFDVIKF